MVRLTGFEPVTIRLEGGCSIRLSYRRMSNDINIMEPCLEELVGAVGFEPTTPWSQTRCATKLRHAPFILAFVSHIMRYGVHSRRDVLRRQHLYSKKLKKPIQMYIYQAPCCFFNSFLWF